MLPQTHAYTKLPASDPQRAKRFYVDVLGFVPAWEKAGHVWLNHADGSSILVFPSSGKASGDHDQCGWVVDNVEAEVVELRSRGVVFEEFPGRKYVDGITVDGYWKAAWFRDTEGNLLNVRGNTPREASHRTAMVKGLHIAYDDAGAGMPAVVLIHGAFANRSHVVPQLAHLALRHRVVALDLRGHGDSDVPSGGFRVRDFAEDVIAVCEAAAVDRAVLCGHSRLGGGIALDVASAKPDLVAGIAMLDAAMLYPAGIREQALTNLVPALEGEGWVDTLRAFFARTFGPYDSPALKAKVMEEIGRAPAHMAAPLMRDLLSEDFTAQLSSGEYPLLFVHAKAPTDVARLQQLRPDVQLGSVVGSGHYLTLAIPDQVNAMLDRFLQIVASRS